MATPFVYHAKAQSTFKPPLIANENAFLGDIDSRYGVYTPTSVAMYTDNHSDRYNPDKPMTAGFYRLEKGTPLVYEYTYDEMKIILEGEFEIADETGQKVTATPGDVFHFPKGTKVTFTTPSYGLAFFTGQRAKGGA
ncbi:cupin domain-containing protein [Aspergillus candidus]|uniref:RmlC-like cupin domain-containing protein n=1 Tax=Aspergillus candidus TaxID=41067 RepID=A0A2I2FEG7_ASPCN|nr:RmlC-like cupin domain-containing protein [Aspergillus candidus]PLB39022.1 RmlC-like cupin domain-containing protein [Aspergillus candidus]